MAFAGRLGRILPRCTAPGLLGRRANLCPASLCQAPATTRAFSATSPAFTSQQSEAISGIEAERSSRPRGRPRKSSDHSDQIEAVSEPKRRGRPPKKPKEETNPRETEAIARPAAKRRGRPKLVHAVHPSSHEGSLDPPQHYTRSTANRPLIRPTLPLGARAPDFDPTRLRASVYKAQQDRVEATRVAFIEAAQLAREHDRITRNNLSAASEEEIQEEEEELPLEELPKASASISGGDPGFDMGQSTIGKVRMLKREERMEELLNEYKPLWDLSPAQQKELIETGQDFPHLPPVKDWRSALEYGFDKDTSFHAVNHILLNNSDTIEKIFSHLKLDEGPPRFIIEGYAGAGSVTQRFLRHPNVSHVYALENGYNYWSWLRTLENPPADAGVDGSRLVVFPYSAWEWNTYSDLEKGGAFDIPLRHRAVLPSQMVGNEVLSFQSDDWKEDIPIEVFMTIPNTTLGEQLVVQLICAIGSRTWMFRYGRVKMHLIITESLADRLVISSGTYQRSKINVLAESLATVDYHMRGDEFLPLPEHTYSPSLIVGKGAWNRAVKSTFAPKTDNAASGLNRQRLAFVTITPRIKPLVSVDLYPTFDWLMKSVLVLRNHPVTHSMRHVSPGAEEVVYRLAKGSEFLHSDDEIIDPDARVCDLSATQLVALARVFDLWPFKPPEVELEIANGQVGGVMEEE